MQLIEPGIVIAWAGAESVIPGGWSRESALDDRYFVVAQAAADADPSTTLGAATHGHTSPAHTPTQNDHAHTTSSGLPLSGTVGLDSGSSASAASTSHTHATFPLDSAIGANQAATINVTQELNDLYHVKVIWLRSNGASQGFPNGSIAFFGSDSIPTGWSRIYGGLYIKGCPSSLRVAGAVTGSNTHIHTSPGHTHLQDAHEHTGYSETGDLTLVAGTIGGPTSPYAPSSHDHTLAALSTTPTNQPVTTTLGSANHEPLFRLINFIQNVSGQSSIARGIISIWLGRVSQIPNRWSQVTGYEGRFLKAASSDGETGTTGGTTTHTHTATSCQPIQNPHTHAIQDDGLDFVAQTKRGFTDVSSISHRHTFSASSDTATNNAVGVTIDSEAASAYKPPHISAILVSLSQITDEDGDFERDPKRLLDHSANVVKWEN